MNINDFEFLKNMRLPQFTAFCVSFLSIIAPFAILMYLYDREFMVNNNLAVILIILLSLGSISFMPNAASAMIHLSTRKLGADVSNRHSLIFSLASISHLMVFTLFMILLHLWYNKMPKAFIGNINDFISISFYLVALNFIFSIFMVILRFIRLAISQEKDLEMPNKD